MTHARVIWGGTATLQRLLRVPADLEVGVVIPIGCMVHWQSPPRRRVGVGLFVGLRVHPPTTWLCASSTTVQLMGRV